MTQKKVPIWVSVFVLPAVNICLAFLVSAILFSYLDINPLDAAASMWVGAFGSGEGLGYTLYYATGFIFTGLSVAVAFHAGLFNIGGEGQAYVGGLGVGLVCLVFGNALPFVLLLPLAIMTGALLGAAWAFIPAWLQARRGSHIVITTIMFNFLASSLMAFLLVEVLKPAGSMAAESRVFASATWLPKLSEVAQQLGFSMSGSPLNVSFFWALICAVLVWVLIWRTRWGYEIRSMGANQSAAAYAGIAYSRVVMLAMLISGALSGFFALNALQGGVL